MIYEHAYGYMLAYPYYSSMTKTQVYSMHNMDSKTRIMLTVCLLIL